MTPLLVVYVHGVCDLHTLCASRQHHLKQLFHCTKVDTLSNGIQRDLECVGSLVMPSLCL